MKDLNCVNKHHVSPKTRNSKRYCDLCNSYVDELFIIKKRKNCPCCNSITIKKKNKSIAKSILDKALVESKEIISGYNVMPISTKDVYFIVFVKYEHFTYSIPINIMSRYAEAFQNWNVDNNSLFTDTIKDGCSFSRVLKYCEKRIKFVGFR